MHTYMHNKWIALFHSRIPINKWRRERGNLESPEGKRHSKKHQRYDAWVRGRESEEKEGLCNLKISHPRCFFNIKRKDNNFAVGKLERCQVNEVIKVINPHDELYWHHEPLDMVHGKHYIIFRAFLAKTHNHSNVTKPLHKFTLRDILQNNLSVLFRNVKAMKDNERMRNCLKLERSNGEGSGTPLLPGTHSTLASKIPWMEELGSCSSWGR